MLFDIWTVARKDLKEIFIQRGSLRSGIANVLIVIAISGILFPLQWGVEWINSPVGLISILWLPLFMSMGLVADAFAGERERHTLETLLASRLSDSSILYGKMLASILYGFGITLAGLLLGAVTVNLSHPGAGFYPVPYFLGALGLSLLGLVLITGLGVLISLRASNVRQAYQRMSLGFIVLWLPIIIAPKILSDATKLQISQQLAAINEMQAIIAAAAVLLVLDLGLIFMANVRFRRSQLILD